MRQIVLDTETTGLEPELGHRVIEIGCIEIVDRRITPNRFHHYLNPQRDIDPGAIEIHGIQLEDLRGKPTFAAVAAELLAFIREAEVLIHNAPFDVGFLNHELNLADPGHGRIEDCCTVVDTLALARQLHPGQRNSLDALCKRYGVDNSHRELHGALLDAEILADVYLAMTGGQATLWGEHENDHDSFGPNQENHEWPIRRMTAVIKPSAEELVKHSACLRTIAAVAKDGCVWLMLPD